MKDGGKDEEEKRDEEKWSVPADVMRQGEWR